MTYRIFFLLFATIFITCTPKTPEVITETKPSDNQPEQPANPCATFEDAPNPDMALENFVLYRDFKKSEEYDVAFDYWKKAFKDAPAADGKRATVFTDGVFFYETFMQKDTTKKAEYLEKIFELYDKMEKCYPEGGYAQGLKAFDYFFKYPYLASKKEQYDLFKKSIELDDGKPRFFVLNPFTSLLVDLTLDGEIPLDEAKKYQQTIIKTIQEGLADCEENKDCENWKIINEYAPARLEALESIKGFYECQYYIDKYYPDFEANPNDCETINTVYSRLRFGDCGKDLPELQAINQAYLTNCKETGPSCNDMLREGDYTEAINCLETAIETMAKDEDKATFNLFIAKIYFAHLKNFSKARQYARKAANLRSGWGEPYLLIGTLYASSGPLCGPGRGWDSQRVVWAAIDKWQVAKSDPATRAEAQKLINQYAQYMPELGEIFQRGLAEGQSYKVPCWIQETTTIRAKK
ncbi:MAG: hypothetical protein AAFZ15_10840 [Bacteroidota bacterium]